MATFANHSWETSQKRNETFAIAENLQRHDWGLLSWEGTRFFGEKMEWDWKTLVDLGDNVETSFNGFKWLRMAVPRRTSLSSLQISMGWKFVLIFNEKRRKVLRLELKKKLLQYLQRCFPLYGTIAIPPLKPLGLGICKEGLWKADPSENPITPMRSMRVDYLGVGRCDNGAAELGGGGGDFSTVLSKWEGQLDNTKTK